MTNRTDLQRGLWSILNTLAPYLEDLVLVGGWVPYLHLTYGRGAVEGASTSLTGEADLLLPAGLDRGERRPIAEILEEAGFRPLGKSRVVWAREVERGEKIEFLRTHRGPALSRGRPFPIPDQPRLRALSLDHLRIQERFTEELPIPTPGKKEVAHTVRVPLLAAFALNKANTFNLRGGTEREAKAGKDLLYLRDVMAAGTRAQEILETDLESMIESEERGRVLAECRRATQHLRAVAPRFHRAAGAILAEREGTAAVDARADIVGHLTDLTEILEGHL